MSTRGNLSTPDTRKGYRVYLCQVESGTIPVRSAALEAVFKPVSQPPTTFEETVERLGTAIRLGLSARQSPPRRARPGRAAAYIALHTSACAQHAGAERTPGGAQGPRRGTFVADEPPLVLSDEGPALGDPARELLDYRRRTGVTVLAAERAGDGALTRLDELTESMAREAPFEDYRRADVRFHICLAEAAWRTAPRGCHDGGAGPDERPDRPHRASSGGAGPLECSAPADRRHAASPRHRPRFA